MQNIDANTLLTIIIGHPVNHSKSPVFQNAALQHCGINALYTAVDIEKDNFKEVITGLKKIKLFGMNITVPYKSSILEFVDDLKDEARIINSVNTIEVSDNKWIGHNTDWFGVFKTLETRSISQEQNVLIVGAGGATNGLVYGLKQFGIKNISVTNRTMEKADTIAGIFNLNTIDYSVYKNRFNDFSMIINSTTMEFNELFDSFSDDVIYYDLKYYKSKPGMIKNYIDGKDMLLYQGTKAFEIWTKQKAPLEVMEKALS